MSLVALVILLGAIAFLMHRSFLLPLKARLLAAAAESERHEKMASLGVLATGVAHEIRNPLTAIKFRLFSLKKSLGEDLATNEDYQTIRNEIDRLETLVKNFLEFARPDDPNFSRIVPSELLRDVERLLEPELTRKKITLQLDVADELDFQGDRQQLRQVLINLVQNAADSMQQGGTITLRAHAGSAGFREGRGAAVLLEVIDTGAGIDAEVQKRIFDPFFSTKEGGTGLGLAIASRIVEQHGGMLQVSTRKDHGSTFTLVLPAVQSTTTH
jgi:signal transduction histidine kinase